MLQCKLLTPEEFKASEDARIAALAEWAKTHGDGWTPEKSALSRSFRPPGTMWFCSWYHDPNDPDDQAVRAHQITRPPEEFQPGAARQAFLSQHYFRDWADKRPPICVVCPGGLEWIPDQCSNNGDGWTVTGEAPLITCSPSIWVGQGKGAAAGEYHGWLQNGVFSAPV